MLLENRIALITGSGSGMGRASAVKMAGEGAMVVVADVNLDGAEETVARIKDAGVGDAVAYRIDVSDVSQIDGMFDFVGREYGRLNVLFNHVGTPGPAGLNVSEAEFARTIDLNMKSAFYCTRAGEKLLRAAAGQASVIFTSSISGMVGSLFSPLYSMVKGGIVGFTRALALSLAPDIRVNVICPGAVDTPMLNGFFGRDPDSDPKANVKMFIETSVPLRRLSTAEEIADAAVFLASDRSSFITGLAMPIDGGYTAR
ncbi:NAD(P)-dependent dehydrogenase, short-chain alcohol dehydrogenase family [Micromonospora pallida]|uniref:NAD(P)-dependent dehydrogenase, short-chain alcohol dehydrogenase family n=1 Tax=Micromonospora pallida TaxID=145854 RepID=A0A1C6RSR9_9ACTN|nr:SDR family oxidoreductase [Micromonospora pallida]SCL20083.1 NAD(P)-dependent dehydrogenase, short-chain alcohol dehydrogenase family [Micromonospora pallida]